MKVPAKVGCAASILIFTTMLQLISACIMFAKVITAVSDDDFFPINEVEALQCSGNTYFCAASQTCYGTDGFTTFTHDPQPANHFYLKPWFCWALVFACGLWTLFYLFLNKLAIDHARKVEKEGEPVVYKCSVMYLVSSLLRCGIVATLSICFVHEQFYYSGCLKSHHEDFYNRYHDHYSMLKYTHYLVLAILAILGVTIFGLCCGLNTSDPQGLSDFYSGSSNCCACLMSLVPLALHAIGVYFVVLYCLLGGPYMVDDAVFNISSLIYVLSSFDRIFLMCYSRRGLEDSSDALMLKY